MSDLHRQDFHAWTRQQADLIRSGRFGELDAVNLIDEIEDMGGSRERELESRLGVLLAHLLKWRYQPDRRSRSWRLTIMEQRRRIARLLKRNPSLKPLLVEVLEDAYGDALLIAARETDLDESAFPPACPFSLEQVMDASWLE